MSFVYFILSYCSVLTSSRTSWYCVFRCKKMLCLLLWSLWSKYPVTRPVVGKYRAASTMNGNVFWVCVICYSHTAITPSVFNYDEDSQFTLIPSSVCHTHQTYRVIITCIYKVFMKKHCRLVLMKVFEEKKCFTLCLCSGISSGGLLQKLVRGAFTKLKFIFESCCICINYRAL